MKRAAQYLDEQLKVFRSLGMAKPPKGWVRAIRDALGMTTEQLAQRMGVSQSRIPVIEQSERSGRTTVQSLERAAEAMGCHFVYAFVPERSLEKTMRERAEKIVDKQMRSVVQTMNLENQTVQNKRRYKELREKMIADLLDRPSLLWAQDE